MVSWGNDDFSNDPNPSKELTSNQRELFVLWLTNPEFYNDVLSQRDRKTITSVLIMNKYNTHNKWVLDQVREKYISYRKKQSE